MNRDLGPVWLPFLKMGFLFSKTKKIKKIGRKCSLPNFILFLFLKTQKTLIFNVFQQQKPNSPLMSHNKEQ